MRVSPIKVIKANPSEACDITGCTDPEKDLVRVRLNVGPGMYTVIKLCRHHLNVLSVRVMRALSGRLDKL